ncbi:MAG: cytochrome c oxidase subunit II [Proteobacteria bacterium]|nr:cytochrome c oxidase subunit II [Pseudomonadota bacterium]MBI3496554.1 cytochrome c oxidase subunit II [Pseudomonadota bacterium]
MRGLIRLSSALALTVVSSIPAGLALAAEPLPWQMDMQPAASLTRERITSLHDFLLVVITVISVFVLGLLLYTMVRFRASKHPVPTKTSHNTVIEILWTVIPVVILVIIAVPSFRLLYFADRVPVADMTLKVTGHQWYWSYEYPDSKGLAFDSYMIPLAELKPGQKRLLDVDNPLVLPVDTTVRLQFVGVDVLHSWFMPAFGVQLYTTPGRINESWVKVTKEGTFYGECNQICGINHAYMPIAVKVVSKAEFAKWVEEAKKKFASDAPAPAIGALAAAFATSL